MSYPRPLRRFTQMVAFGNASKNGWRSSPLDGLQVALIERHVQRKIAARIQVRISPPREIFFRIQRRGSLHEYVQRIGGNDVEFLRSGQQIVPRVVEYDVRSRIVQHVVQSSRAKYFVEVGGITGSISHTVIFSIPG